MIFCSFLCRSDVCWPTCIIQFSLPKKKEQSYLFSFKYYLIGRLTLTNQALYFEASGIVSYETALKIDLSRADAGHQLKETSTGPWGAPLFDKAIAYESSEL